MVSEEIPLSRSTLMRDADSSFSPFFTAALICSSGGRSLVTALSSFGSSEMAAALMKFWAPGSKPRRSLALTKASWMPLSRGLIMGAFMPQAKAMVRKAALIRGRAGRPKETLLVPMTQGRPNSFLYKEMVFSVSLAPASEEPMVSTRGSSRRSSFRSPADSAFSMMAPAMRTRSSAVLGRFPFSRGRQSTAAP